MIETWKPTVGFEGYSVSDDGRVRRDKPGPGAKPGLILKRQYDTHGYPMVHLWVCGKRHGIKIHRLVGEAFLQPRPEWAECIAHIDGKPENSHVSNLRWSTLAQNQADRVAHGTTNRGSRHGASKLTEKALIEAKERRAAGETVLSIATSFGVHRETLGKALRGESWAWFHD